MENLFIRETIIHLETNLLMVKQRIYGIFDLIYFSTIGNLFILLL